MKYDVYIRSILVGVNQEGDLLAKLNRIGLGFKLHSELEKT